MIQASDSLALLAAYLFLGGLLYAWALGATANAWGPLDAIYFAFTSIATIGFGDIVPMEAEFLAIASIVYLAIGLALCGLIMTRLSEAVDERLASWAGIQPAMVAENGPMQMGHSAGYYTPDQSRVKRA
ncbi:unnamed protein product [Protopolystoma xenopodis]|uniref:Potassium channel domain-containing protein n=1 Tax=Protopolystoma xenopodis TaxID=117903 RepID=A0A448WFZ7_9PLAT|nr:unnamed protein product [Protopolystoma xenopodis]